MSEKYALVWFRNNLRLSDNKVLFNALKANKKLVLLYVFDERLWKENINGHTNTSPRKLWFLWESVNQLRQNIEALGGSLLIKRGRPAATVLDVMNEFNCQALFTSEEAGVYERESLTEIEQSLMKAKVRVSLYSESTLYHPDDIPWPIGKLPEIFTQFRKENERQTKVREVDPKPISLSQAKWPFERPTAKQLGIENPPAVTQGVSLTGGENEGLDRLKYYLWESNKIKSYKETRNGLIGMDYSSKLSPWLANGCLSPRVVYEELKSYEEERGANQSTYWLYFELLWRDYFHFILKKYGKQLFSVNGIKEEAYQWNTSKENFKKWCQGETGVPFVDANMKELNATGFMSNRGRQLVASFLTHDLNIDWRWGAYYFERMLIDYDVASNWGNWAYIAGVGNDPRENRYFNMLSQAKKYDSNGDYVRLWLPELKEIQGFNVHKIALLKEADLLTKIKVNKERYISPMIDMHKWDH